MLAVLMQACSGDEVNLTSLDCNSLIKDRPYHYESVVTFDLAERPAGALPEQAQDYGPEAFRYSREIEGTVEAVDKLEASIHQEGSVDLRFRVLGNQGWAQVSDRDGDFGAWEATPIDSMGELFPVERVCALLAPEVNLESARNEKETIDGVESVHYSFPSVQSQFPTIVYGPQSDFARLMPTLDLDVWLATGNGHPVRFRIEGRGHYENERALTLSISSEVVEVRDESVNISPP